MNSARKKSGKLSSSKHRRHKRREGRCLHPEGSGRDGRVKECHARGSRHPALERSEESQKRPRTIINEHVQGETENDGPYGQIGMDNKSIGDDKKQASATPQKIERKKPNVNVVVSPKKNMITPFITPSQPKIFAREAKSGDSSKLSSTSYRKLKRCRSRDSTNKENTSNKRNTFTEKTNGKNHVVTKKSLECKFDACMDNSGEHCDDSNCTSDPSDQKSRGTSEKLQSVPAPFGKTDDDGKLKWVDEGRQKIMSHPKTAKKVEQSPEPLPSQLPGSDRNEKLFDTLNEKTENIIEMLFKREPLKMVDQELECDKLKEVKPKIKEEIGHADPLCHEVVSKKKQVTRQVTLTQGDFLETVAEKKPGSRTECATDDTKSVKIRTPRSLKDEEYSKGDVWESADAKYYDVAFTLGDISVVNMEHVAEVSQMWLKLCVTYIGPDQAANVKESCTDCEWVMVDKHHLMPKDGMVQLKTLCNKLDADEIPKSALYYREDAPTFEYLYQQKGQFTPPTNQDRPIALDLFAGGGGMSIGLKRAGWNVKYKVEKDMACCQTLRKNFSKKKKVYNMDITKFLRDLKAGRLNIDTKKITLVHASPPCQGFSGANTSGGNNDWQNKQCTLDFLEVVEHIQPPFVSMENVPGMAQKRKINDAKDTNKSYLQKVMGKLISMGYHVSLTMTWASYFGDPQNRKRLVLLAAKRGYKLPSVPKRTHGENEGLKPIVNVQDVLNDLENIEPNCSGRVELNNGKIVQGHFIDGTAMASSNDDDERLYAEHPLAPAKTVRKKNNICHYNLDRYLTLLEYKRLMSFPDNHKLEGTRREMRDQVGNAVPCHFAEAIGKAIIESYRLGTHTHP